MRMLGRLRSAMGEPLALRALGRPGRVSAAIARWRHGGVCVDRGEADALQLVFNITGGQRVELCWPDRCLRDTAAAGSVAVMPAEGPDRVNVSGADAVHILLRREWVTAVTHRPAASVLPVRAARPLRLQALGAQALVALSQSGGGSSDDVLRGIAWRAADLLGRPTFQSWATARGGLSPTACRQVRALVDARLNADWCAPPSVQEMAAVAGLSVGHFSKAFRESEGQTPYAFVNARRIGRAVSMLLRVDARVDDVSDRIGFCSPAHFVSFFRQHLGVTPGALRDAAGSNC